MPIRSSVTVSLVPEAAGGPFVFSGDLAAACASAATLGFDAIEVFPPAPDAPAFDDLPRLLADHGLTLAALGTGAGWLVRRLTLTSPDPATRRDAVDFVRAMLDRSARHGAPTIIGSLQGRTGPGVDRATALGHLADALETLGAHASSLGVSLLIEPLNRYETDLVNTVGQGLDLIDRLSNSGVKILADVFHMNIEEQDIATAIRAAGARLGHLHFVDSNRRAVGMGHVDFGPIADALAAIGFDGYASAEALPLPDPELAARQTIDAYRSLLVRIEEPPA